jgi:hypothetical protein
MRCILLAINPICLLSAAQSNQTSQRQFGSICLVSEHRLPKNSSSDRHAIQTACKLSINPCLNAMGIALLVQFYIGLDHLLDYPST